MGQSYALVNPAKKQYIYPHQFGEGYKEWEILANGRMSKALLYLIAVSNGGGGGDLRQHNYKDGSSNDPDVKPGKMYGAWAGDPIFLVGDYDDSAPHSEGFGGLYQEARESFEDVSLDVLGELMLEDIYDDGDLLQFHSWLVGIIGTKAPKKPSKEEWAKMDAGEKHEHETSVSNAKKMKTVVPLLEKAMSPETRKKAQTRDYYGRGPGM